ncbi:hypothetical protein M9Y10_012277 [Tritrichomonas musculus]|uniref:Rap-GAP domain-containing protein n=1 Tax=Tritrichomonas musculus TaxID=1915356 RepID=A0ABR2IC18_9EUKA
MWKKITNYIKPFTQNQNPITFDNFDAYLDHIQKAITSQNLSDPKIITARATKKAIEKISKSMSAVITTNPIHVRKDHSKVSNILCQFLVQSVEGDLRKSVWINTVNIITACDLVVDFQQWESIIVAAFFIKNLRTMTDTKIGEILVDQAVAITNSINIATSPPKFNYWMNIIAQFIFPLFWGNYKCIDKKCQSFLVIPFFSFFNRNMAMPNSIPTLSSFHKNQLIPYYTMELLIQAEQMLPSGKQVEFTKLHAILLSFLQFTFPIKISLNQDASNIYPDIPKNAQFRETITFLISKQIPNNQNNSFINQIINSTNIPIQGSTPTLNHNQNSNLPNNSDLIDGNQLVDYGNRNMQLILTFFRTNLTKQAAEIIMQISRSKNIFPEVILVISTIFCRLTEALLHSLLKKATANTSTTTTSKTTKSIAPVPKYQQQLRQKPQQSNRQRPTSQGPINDLLSSSNDLNVSDNSDLSFEQNSGISTDNSSDTTASSSYQNFQLTDNCNSIPSFEVFSKSPSTSSFSSIDTNEQPNQVSSPPKSTVNQISSNSPKRYSNILRGKSVNQSNSSSIPPLATPIASSSNSPTATQNNQIKTMTITTTTTITTVTTNLTPPIIQSYIELFDHLLHLRPFFSACTKYISPEKLGSTLFRSIFTCQNRFCIHQLACVLFTAYFDAIRYTPEHLRTCCENLISFSRLFDLSNELKDIFNLYSSIFATICSHQLLEMNKNTDNSFDSPLPPSEEAILSNPVYYAMKSNVLNTPKIPYLFFAFPLYYTNTVSSPTQQETEATSIASDQPQKKNHSNSIGLDFNVKIDSNMANNFASAFLNGIGKYNNYSHTAKFVDVLFSIYLMAKKHNCKCNSAFIYNKTCPMLFDLFLKSDKTKSANSNILSKPILNTLCRLFENLIVKQIVEPNSAISWLNFFFEVIKISTNKNSSNADTEIALKALSTCMKCCCSPFPFRYSVIPFVNSHILMDYTSMFNYETATNNFLDKNSYINNALRYFSSTIDISRQIKEAQVGSTQNFSLSLQFFNEFVTDSQFRLSPYFYTTFFYVFQSQIANDEIKKLAASSFSLFKKLISNLRTISDPECFLNLISVIPYHYEEIKAKCPELIPLFFNQVGNYSRSNQCSLTSFKIIMRFISDLLVNLDVNDPLFEKAILFLLQPFDQNPTKNRFCNENFSFFLSKFLNSYRKKTITNSDNNLNSLDKEKQCAIIDNKSAIITFNLYSTYITISNVYNTDNYSVNITTKEKQDELKTVQNNTYFKDHTLGSLIQNNKMETALLTDAFLSQKREKHWLIFTQYGLNLAENFNDRPSMEKHIIPIIYIKTKQRKVEEILTNRFDQTSNEFVSFLASLGENVKVTDTPIILSIEKMISLIKQNIQQHIQGNQMKTNTRQQQQKSPLPPQQTQSTQQQAQQQRQPFQQQPQPQQKQNLQQQPKFPPQPPSSLLQQQRSPPLQQDPQQLQRHRSASQFQQQPQQQPHQLSPQPQRPVSQYQQSNNTCNKKDYLLSHLESIHTLLTSLESGVYFNNCRHETLFVPYPSIRLQDTTPNLIKTTVSIIWFESPYDIIKNKILNSLFIILLRPVSGGNVLVNVRANFLYQKNPKDINAKSTDDYLKLNFIPFGSTNPFLVPNSIIGFVIRDLVLIIDNHINNINKLNNMKNSSSQAKNTNNPNSKNNPKSPPTQYQQQNIANNQNQNELTLSACLHSETKIAYENVWSVLDQMDTLF